MVKNIITPQIEKWIPSKGEQYFYPGFETESGKFKDWECTNENDELAKNRIENWYIFKDQKDCIQFCDKLNQTIKNIKL